MSDFHEFDFISSLPQTPKKGLKLGIGDDAAIFDSPGPWAISTDSIVENSHFLNTDSPREIAQKLVRVNVSDMAAMGCRPLFFLLNLHLKKDWSSDQLNEFKSGLFDELKTWDMSLIGGDTVSSKDGPLHLVGTILGQPYGKEAIERKGAQNGDGIYVTGALGGSFPKRHLSFTPRVKWSQALCETCPPTSMMDISDGLFQDLGHILDQSKVSAQIHLDRIPIHPDLTNQDNPLKHALSDGEDFELLFTLNPNFEKVIPKQIQCQRIGKIIDGNGEIFAKKDSDLDFNVWPRLGFEHTTHFTSN